MENNNYTIALLIDTENVAAKYLVALDKELILLGKVTYRRMYGDFTGPTEKSWKTLANDYAITPVQQFNYTIGKNASDSRLIIDAMDILYSGNVNAVCLMSSDSDFTGLVKRLKESNIFVIGAGERKTAKSFVNACDRFFYLEELIEKNTEPQVTHIKQKAPKKETTRKKKQKTEEILTREEVEAFAVQILENNNGPYLLSKLMQKIYQRYPQFNFKNYKARKAQDFFHQDKFEISKGKSTELFVELKSEA